MNDKLKLLQKAKALIKELKDLDTIIIEPNKNSKEKAPQTSNPEHVELK